MTDARDLPVIVPHVADVLKGTREFVPRDGKEFKYAFEIPLNQKKQAENIMNVMQLPDTVSWYRDASGRMLFEAKAPDGNFTLVCYLVTS